MNSVVVGVGIRVVKSWVGIRFVKNWVWVEVGAMVVKVWGAGWNRGCN